MNDRSESAMLNNYSEIIGEQVYECYLDIVLMCQEVEKYLKTADSLSRDEIKICIVKGIMFDEILKTYPRLTLNEIYNLIQPHAIKFIYSFIDEKNIKAVKE